MSQLPTTSRYGDFGANNIVIVPTVSFTDKHQTKPGTGNVSRVQITKTADTTKTVTAVTVHSNQIENPMKPTQMSVDESKHANKLEKAQKDSQSLKFPTIDVNRNTANTEDLNKTKKASWASNYLQSIGHNNIKPIKINLSRSKLQKIETDSTSYDFPNKNIIREHIAIGNKTQLGVTFTKATAVPSIDIVSTSSVTTNTNNNNNTITIATPYSTQFAKDNSQAKYCYNGGKHEIDILDAIKSKINWESVQHNPRTMNSPTHKDMCEEFIKEISIKPSTSERKRENTKSSTKSKRNLDKHSKKSSSKLDAKVKKLDKGDKKNQKESLKTIKKKTSDKDKVKKIKASLVNKVAKKEKEPEKEKTQNKKPQKIKPIIDVNDFDFLTKQVVSKDTEIKPKTDDLGLTRKKLKRVRTISEEPPHNSNSKKIVHSPVKSNVRKTEKCHGNSPKRQRLEIDEGFDLRSKLSRANQRVHRKQKGNDTSTTAKTQDNLKIPVENKNTVKIKSPKKSNVLKYKTKKRRKLKLIINVVCQESDDESSSSDSNINETKYESTQNMDLSFLDDFNVDEIVDSLQHSPKHKMKSPLPNESKSENCTEMSEEPQRSCSKLATILNMLQAKSETNKLKKSVKAEYNIEETVTSNSSVGSNQVMNTIKKEENDYNENKNATHALIKILSQTKSQLDQQKTAPPVDESLVAKCGSQVLVSNIGFNINQEKMCSEDSDKLVIDESVIFNEHDISVVDLTDETLLPTSSEVYNDSIEAIQNFIQSQMQNVKVDSKNFEKDEYENLPTLKPVNNNSELISRNHLNKNPEDENKNSDADRNYIDVEIETNTLANNDDVFIDLTEESLNDDIHEVMERNSANSQKQVENEVTLKQETHFKPLPNVEKQILNNNSENYKMTSTVINEQPTKLVDDIRLTIDRFGDTNIKANELAANKSTIVSNDIDDPDIVINGKNMNNTENAKQNEKNIPKSNKIENKPANEISVIVNNNNDTVKVRIEANIKNTDKAKENVKIKPETTKLGVKENLDMHKVFETKAAKTIIKNIVDSVWDNDNELENTSKTNQTQNKIVKTSNETKTVLETLPNSKIVPVEKNTVPGKILSCQRKALTILLEERMLDYLRKEIKVIQHIHLGKFSNIYSCKDSATGEMYAAKILKNPNNRHTLGIQKEQMIRQLQQDIPRENLNTVYLIDGFGIERHWCFLTEYYPKNLQQVFIDQTKPFHIDLVQDLTRQLISAVMILRNNYIVHSDIKPSHILINTTHDRLKLCGFDAAYCGDNMYPLPNIGTSSYRAPEIILGYSANYSIDVWASALVIYQMATNQRLFTGVYNNDILYKQMCTFGNLSRDMLEASPFKDQHFQGNVFMRRVGYKGQDAVLHVKFFKTKRLHRSLISAYNKHWSTKDTFQRNSDISKITALSKLLEQMLLLDPRFRLAIEFVCTDPFIYEMYS